ncbi:MAG: hypothetical protein LBK73_02860 [Treponema sp.]|jgi:ABC-type cobalt transport system substrate-binding protein|nr:hypothetical protein [Treponema sp.]
MKKMKILWISVVLLMLASVMAFAGSWRPKEGYYTSKDNGYQILIREVGYDTYFIQYFGPNGGKILTSQGKVSDATFTLDFTDDAGNKKSIRLTGPTAFKDYVTGGTFIWNRNP